MASALERVIDWSQGLPKWQSDAVRRLLTQQALTPSDENELLAMLKAAHGLIDPEPAAPSPRPVRKGDVSGAGTENRKICLKSIGCLANVNAIPDGSTLLFGHQGLTVVYGENATGKSGYARVLKRACHARDSKEELRPNVFQDPPHAPASAVFHLNIDGSDKDIAWVDGSEQPDILANISVFDGRCARLILDEDSRLTYLPFGAFVFEELVGLMTRLRSRLEAEKPRPKAPDFPDMPPETEPWREVQQLTCRTCTDDWGEWTVGDESAFGDLQRKVLTAKAKDATRQAVRLRNLRDRSELLGAAMKRLEELLSDAPIGRLVESINQLGEAKRAFKLAAEDLGKEPLAGVGEHAWQMLYDAARKYSLDHAYPKSTFPNVGEGSRCVLCMQPLQEEAKDRFRRFHRYMEQALREKIKRLSQQVVEARERIGAADFSIATAFKDVLDEAEALSPGFRNRVAAFASGMEARAQVVLNGCDRGEVVCVSPVAPIPTTEAEEVAKQLERGAGELEKARDPAELAMLEKALAEMEGKRALLRGKRHVQVYVAALRTAERYDACIAATDFRAITNEGKRIVSEAMTPRLVECLKEEITALEASHVPLRLRTSATRGETRHSMELAGCRSLRGAPLTEVLSEGEQRVVAIAGFLAELRAYGHGQPIVFDDPVSSLDHVYRDRIARRLVQESKTRQVIVFTHDIAFLLSICQEAAESGGVCLTTQTVRRQGHVPGRVVGTLPWHALPVKERLRYLNEELLPRFEGFYGQDIDTYNREAGYLYGLLRETWEAFVEEELLNSVVARHRASIQTLRLKEVMVGTEDYRVIDFGIAHCSKWMIGHDKARGLDVNRPAPKEIREDLKDLSSFVKAIRTRRAETKKERDRAMRPGVTEVG